MELKDWEVHLPKFLPDSCRDALYRDLQAFPDNINNRMYGSPKEFVLQGDGFKHIQIFNLPDLESKEGNAIILSNTCDLSAENERNFATRVLYSPLIKLATYINGLKDKNIYNANHIDEIKKQRVSQIFFLPAGSGLTDDSIVFLDRVCSMPKKFLDNSFINSHHLFSLSNFGFYLFLVKISIHFTRVQDSVNRDV